ncbi:MAG: segregation/condensation protein A [Anaerolineae bacterium]|nr:segregation/condensation protein A [Anaerolineae bacterium]
MERPTAYRVELEVFAGPLDLLLQLIEQEQMDITEISLAKVTDQYLAYLRLVEERQPGELAQFVAIAARLLVIKSRALLPQPPRTDADEEEDVGVDLVRQLREYRRFKQVAMTLRDRDEAGLHMYLRALPGARTTRIEPRLDLENTSLDDLIDALRSLLEDETVATDDALIVPYAVTISERIDHIGTVLRARGRVRFTELLRQGHSRLELIVTLLAILEMIRTKRVTAHQETLFGPIAIEALRGEDPGTAPSAAPPDGTDDGATMDV